MNWSNSHLYLGVELDVLGLLDKTNNVSKLFHFADFGPRRREKEWESSNIFPRQVV